MHWMNHHPRKISGEVENVAEHSEFRTSVGHALKDPEVEVGWNFDAGTLFLWRN